MPHLSFCLLGTFHVTLDGKTLANFDSHKVRALLAYLAVECDRPHSRDSLAGLLWSDLSNRAAHDNLRYALANLRDVIHDRGASPPFLIITRDSIQFNPAGDFDLDVRAWQTTEEPTAINHLQSAVSQYRGKFLDGFSCDSAPFEEWVLLTRERITQRVLRALRALIAHYEPRGKYDRVETYARKQLELEPWDEQAHQTLMRTLAQKGQRNAALVQYEACRRLLQQDLGVEPALETTRLYESIRDGKLERRPPTNLPIPQSSFIGRERELAEIERLLRTTRLLTLTGAGGCGKTRLALQIAMNLASKDDPVGRLYEDGIWWIDLAPLNDPTVVAQAIAAMFDLRESPSQSWMNLLTNYFHSQAALVILDNCEHLIGACAHVVGVLQSACPKLHFLITSREQLNVSGELVWRVPSMASPPAELSLEHLRQFDTVQLFTERSRGIAPRWSLAGNGAAVAQICARLDGIPLAIELAAAQLDRFSAKEIEHQLADRFHLLAAKSGTALPRHQTLRAAIDWSYHLLDDPERELFARLGVFVGGGTLAAVEAICGNPADEISTADRSTLLMDKSLLQRVETEDEPRLLLLETIRSYAAEKLDASDKADEIRRKHLAYFTAMAEQLELKLWGSDSLVSLALLETESGNLSAAMDWGLNSAALEDVELGVRLAGAMYYYWYERGYLTEGRRWLERAISKPQVSRKTRAKVLAGTAMLVTQQGDYAIASKFFEESTWLWRELEDDGKSGLAEALHQWGHLAFDQREYATARALFAESHASYEGLGDENLTSILNSDLGLVGYHQGDYGLARERFETSLDWFQAHGNEQYAAETRERLGDLARLRGDDAQAKAYYENSLGWFQKEKSQLGIASALHKLAFLAQHRGEYARARMNLLESLKLQGESGNKQGIAECLAGMAGLAAALGNPERAARLFGAARALLDAIGAPLAPADLAEWTREETAARAQLDPAAFDAAWAEGRAMTMEQAIEYALKTQVSMNPIPNSK